jgi:hypothetical protein
VIEQEDQWSDIDLAFGVVDATELTSVLSDWTARLYDRLLALRHLDVTSGAWIYRVFLLPSTLQVGLAFVPGTECHLPVRAGSAQLSEHNAVVSYALLAEGSAQNRSNASLRIAAIS